MFQFSRLPSRPLCIQDQIPSFDTLKSNPAVSDEIRAQNIEGGLPHSEIFGSKPVRSSPKLIAAYHVLHRLLAPRHPSNALISLHHSHYRCPHRLGASTYIGQIQIATSHGDLIKKTSLLRNSSSRRHTHAPAAFALHMHSRIRGEIRIRSSRCQTTRQASRTLVCKN